MLCLCSEQNLKDQNVHHVQSWRLPLEHEALPLHLGDWLLIGSAPCEQTPWLGRSPALLACLQRSRRRRRRG